VLIAAIGHKLYFHETGARGGSCAFSSHLPVLSLLMDYAASVYGAKKMEPPGAARWAQSSVG